MFSGIVTSASIGGGAGDDSVLFTINQTGLGGSTLAAASAFGVTYYFGTNSGSDTLSFGGASSTARASGSTGASVTPLTLGADVTGLGASFTQAKIITAGGSTYTQFDGGNGQTLTIIGSNTTVNVNSVSGNVVNAEV